MAYEPTTRWGLSLPRPPAFLNPSSQEGHTRARNLLAAGCMLGTAFVWALVPFGLVVSADLGVIDVSALLPAVLTFFGLAAASGGAVGYEDPFLFNAGWRTGGVIGCFLFLILRYHKLLLDLFTGQGSEARGYIRASLGFGFRAAARRDRKVGGWAVLYGVFGKFDYVLLAFAVGYIGVESLPIATIIYTVWPIIFILAMATIYKNNDDYKRGSGWTALMILLCFIGFAFAGWHYIPEGDSRQFYVGIGIAVLAALLVGSHHAVMLKWADRLGDELENATLSGNYSAHQLDIFASVSALLVTQFVCAIISFTIGMMLNGEISGLLLLWIVGGFLSAAGGDILFRVANVISDNLGVNAIIYAMPIFALVLLVIFAPDDFLFGQADYFIIGVLIIIVSNLFINSEAEINWGFRGLIFTLGVCGTFVYFRDNVFAFLGLDAWHWGRVEYFGVVGMAATVFTLLLAFRIGRIVSRSDAEENRLFAAFRKLHFLVRRRVIDPGILTCVLQIDETNDAQALKQAYEQARGYIRRVYQGQNPVEVLDGQSLIETEAEPASLSTPVESGDLQMLVDAEADLDALVRSRQSAIVLGELFSLIIFGGITIFLVLFSRPQETEGWPNLLIDLFAMLIAPVIVFLMVNIWDLHRERGQKWLDIREEYGDYLVRFPDAERRKADQWLAVILGVGIVATYICLLGDKRLYWFGGLAG